MLRGQVPPRGVGTGAAFAAPGRPGGEAQETEEIAAILQGPAELLGLVATPAPSPPGLDFRASEGTDSLRYASQGFPHAGPGGRRI